MDSSQPQASVPPSANAAVDTRVILLHRLSAAGYDVSKMNPQQIQEAVLKMNNSSNGHASSSSGVPPGGVPVMLTPGNTSGVDNGVLVITQDVIQKTLDNTARALQGAVAKHDLRAASGITERPMDEVNLLNMLEARMTKLHSVLVHGVQHPTIAVPALYQILAAAVEYSAFTQEQKEFIEPQRQQYLALQLQQLQAAQAQAQAQAGAASSAQ